MAPHMSLLDHVREPHNFNPRAAPFDLLVRELFVQLESATSENKAPFASVSAKKTHIVESFVDTWRTHFGDNIYPAVRLVFPNRDGRKYHLKDVALARLVARLLQLQKNSPDYAAIQTWKRSYQQRLRLVGAGERRSIGDLPLLIARITSRRRDPSAPVKTSVSVKDVNDTLDRLTQLTSTKDQMALLAPFLDRLTITELRFFFSIVLKESMLSFFERSFFNAWHPDAYGLYKVCSDLQKIFWLLTDPAVRLPPSQLCVQPMYQFVPQSSEKLDISYDKLCRKMAVPMDPAGKDAKLVDLYRRENIAGHFLIEEKIDGDRMLMHMVNGKYLWHTRRRRDYTLVYGENVHIGSLTKHLAHAFHESVNSIVLDGEMVAWSKDRKCVLPFGTLRSAAVQEALKQFDVVDVYEGNNSWPLFVVFDILHLNGSDLTDLPLFYRKHLLNKVIREVPHRLEVLEWVRARTPLDIKANMQRIVTENNEGIMVKSFLSKYRVQSRDSTWIKVKPEYLENFGENLDLVVIGKIGRVKTSYMCGLRDDENGGVYKSFCSVANGFSNSVYSQIESRLCNFWVEYNARQPAPDMIQFGTKKPDFWINPANSIVLEIKARSIEATAETPYAAGSTLHNLWCRSVRDDKEYDECISLQDYQDMKARYASEIHKPQNVNRSRKRVLDRVDAEPGKRPKTGASSRVFEGLAFVVATDHKDARTGERRTAQELKRLVVEHGGEVRLDPRQAGRRGSSARHVDQSAAGASTAASLSPKRGGPAEPVVVVGQVWTPRVRRWASAGFDVVRSQWVLACVAEGRLLRLEPQWVFHTASEQLAERLASRTDEFGDSWTYSGAGRGILRHLLDLHVGRWMSAESRRKCMEDWAQSHALNLMFRGVSFFIASEKERREREGDERAGTSADGRNEGSGAAAGPHGGGGGPGGKEKETRRFFFSELERAQCSRGAAARGALRRDSGPGPPAQRVRCFPAPHT